MHNARTALLPLHPIISASSQSAPRSNIFEKGPSWLGTLCIPHSERFCDVALTVKFYCDCNIAKSLRMGPNTSCEPPRLRFCRAFIIYPQSTETLALVFFLDKLNIFERRRWTRTTLVGSIGQCTNETYFLPNHRNLFRKKVGFRAESLCFGQNYSVFCFSKSFFWVRIEMA